MKFALTLLAPCAVAFILSSCGNYGGSANSSLGLANTGPFDRHGNYIEEWADNPSKWRKSGGAPSPHELRTDRLPEIALNDQPPRNSVPLVSSNVSRPTANQTARSSSPVLVKPKPKPQPVAAKPKPKPPAQVRYVVKKGDSLSTIAHRNGSTVAAIQRANRINGTLIFPGQSLTIPKR
jgi:LysM repeat protein